MSHHHHKRHQSRSRSPANKRESQQNRNNDRSKDYDRRADSNERHHHSIQSNRQYHYFHAPVLAMPIDEIVNNVEKHPPVVQALVRELLLERKTRQLTEEKISIYEHDYAYLRAQHEATINNMTLLKHDYDRCRLDLKNCSIELNELRHNNHQLRVRIDHLLNNERQHSYTNEEIFYAKRQRRN
ncbi:unnamed protein product [Rotaria sp. Silwood2]|nr:unnamed protein product [Rotaria sp. Silwood2]CAF2640524.1 unnamed protein product [Rotaria sp. Silwood2]CAF2844195.1 unnamed protein product [Rotaria sp. Silwood2]CAF3048784.1 unnamed protein product [Rotaria sp. Silwood2]CAF4055058.1 unnamed protein product [Rotaria sp. Silwood2]